MRRLAIHTAALVLALIGLTGTSRAATLTVRLQEAGSQFTAELGEVLDMEVAVDAGTEPLTGYAFYLTFDDGAFRLLPAGEDATGEPRPFAPGDFLGGVTLVNRIEQVDGETILSYTEAAGGGERPTGSGSGVVARFRLEVVRRPAGSTTRIRVEERGHDRVPHYVTADAPGVEKRFAEPPGEAVVQVTGFRILPLPDVRLIEGESQVVFDLDAFVDSTAGKVIWSHSRLSEISTAIDPRSNEVTMSLETVEIRSVWDWKMIFTAFEVNEGLTAADTVDIQIAARPLIAEEFPDTMVFAEDEGLQEDDLDRWVSDNDGLIGDLVWMVSGGQNVLAEVAEGTHIALLSATPDFFGQEEISFVVTDEDALSDTAMTLVIVEPVNDPPEVTRVLPVYPVQGEGPLRVPLADLVEDRDDDPQLLQIFLDVEDGLRVEIQGDELVIHGDAPGRRLIDIAVQDTAGAVARGRQVAVVLEPGQSVAPEIARLPEFFLKSKENGLLQLGEWVEDDSPPDELVWEAEVDSGLAVNLQKSQLVVTGKDGFSGTGRVRLTVTDPQGNRDRTDLVVNVLGPDDSLGPRIFNPGKIGLNAEEGEVALDLDRLVQDPDDPNSALIWTVFPSAGLEFDAETEILRLAAGAELVRPASVTLEVRDPADHTDEATVDVLVVRAEEPPQVRTFPEVRLDSAAAEVRLDLDEFAFDDQDFESELVWTVEPGAGVEVEVDPVTHELVVRRAAGDPLASGVTQVLLRVEDTAGGIASQILTVGLPPLFELMPLPDVQLVAGQVDTSITLDDFAVGNREQLALSWSASPSEKVDVQIDPVTHQVRLEAKDASFEGSENVEFTAVDQTGRSLSTLLRVVVRGKGLAPQLRSFPGTRIEVGQEVTVFDLDDFVVDDDPDSLLQWSASGQRTLGVEIDPQTREVTLRAGEAEPGIERIQFLVRDPAENASLGIMEVLVSQGGEVPEIAPLPRILLLAGGPEKQIDLAPFGSDLDTPSGEIVWSVAVEPGIAARLEGSRLTVSVPTGQQGTRTLEVMAEDPQGNRVTTTMQILIQDDATPPALRLAVERHPVFNDLIQIEVGADEILREPPEVRVDGERVEVEVQTDSTYLAIFPFPPEERERLVEVVVGAADRSGNETERRLEVVMSWRDESGGAVQGPVGQLSLHVPDGAAGPGHLALIYLLEGPERPPDSGDGPVYSVELLRQRRLPHPVTLSFAVGLGADPDLGILRWNGIQEHWEEVPTLVDEELGRLVASLSELGLFRLGKISAGNRQSVEPLQHYPNPFVPARSQVVRIVYRLAEPGMVRLEVYNGLGQQVCTLVDGFQNQGTWSALWDGSDDQGIPVGSGGFFIQLTEKDRRRRGSLVLVR